MIIIVKQPKTGAVFLNTNPLFIELSSAAGVGHYFEAIINVNGVFFTKQLWGKISDTASSVDLKFLFNDFFTNSFNQVIATGLLQYQSLQKTITITINEINTISEAVVNTINLNTFYVFSSFNRLDFNHTINLQSLSEKSTRYKLTRNGVISIPFWSTEATFNVTVLDGLIEIYNTDFTTQPKGAFTFNLKLSEEVIAGAKVVVNITSGVKSLQTTIDLIDVVPYNVEKLYYRNNFNVFEYIEFFGLTIQQKAPKKTLFKRFDDTTDIVENEVKDTFKINTGFLLPEDFAMVDAINDAKHIYYAINNNFVECIPITKRIVGSNSDAAYFNDVIEIQRNDAKTVNEFYNYD
jgi:hypothetical protein